MCTNDHLSYYTLSVQAGYSSEVAQQAAVQWDKEGK